MNFKKVTALALTLILALTALAGCKNNNGPVLNLDKDEYKTKADLVCDYLSELHHINSSDSFKTPRQFTVKVEGKTDGKLTYLSLCEYDNNNKYKSIKNTYMIGTENEYFHNEYTFITQVMDQEYAIVRAVETNAGGTETRYYRVLEKGTKADLEFEWRFDGYQVSFETHTYEIFEELILDIQLQEDRFSFKNEKETLTIKQEADNGGTSKCTITHVIADGLLSKKIMEYDYSDNSKDSVMSYTYSWNVANATMPDLDDFERKYD